MPTSKHRRRGARRRQRPEQVRADRLSRLRAELSPEAMSGLMFPDMLIAATQFKPSPYEFRCNGKVDPYAVSELFAEISLKTEKYDMGILPFIPMPGGGYRMPNLDRHLADWASGKLRLPKEQCWFEFYMPGAPEVRFGYYVIETDPHSWTIHEFTLDMEDLQFHYDGYAKHVTNRANVSPDTEIEFRLSGTTPEDMAATLSDPDKVSNIQTGFQLAFFATVALTMGFETKRIRDPHGPDEFTIFDHWKVDLVGKHSGMTPEVLVGLKWKDLGKLEPIDADRFRDIMTQADARFRNKFGRAPGPDDPLICDVDGDQPQHLTVDKLRKMTLEGMGIGGVPPAIAYAYAKTGLMIHEVNEGIHTPEQIEAWEAALAEYKETENTH